ncbi:MAG TPA: GntR family transcriptional regulator [Phycisphaerae bacterium]|nr:GntR family transcriptional regulator [Phycisphaerae bacterium]HPP28162.1 GntR family transcriptional regulator [Phycisphaerae bacterium]
MVARHEIRDSLQQMILNGEQRAGSKLVQQQLAKRFGVAQGVVREALLELRAYGLVETIDNRGMFVTELSTQKLLDSFDVREMHEALAARLCCDRITRREIREMEQMAEEMYGLAKSGKLMEMASLDREFHQRLVHVSQNSMLIRLAENYRVLGKVIQISRDPDEVRAEHLAILKAIEAGDADKAEQLMRSHIRTAKQDLERQIKEGTFVPRWLAGRPEPELEVPVARKRSRTGRATAPRSRKSRGAAE